MNTGQDDDQMSVWVELTDEPEALDLTAGLGHELLDLAIEAMVKETQAGRDPATGDQWLPDRPATVKAKGHDTVGFRTGKLMQPGHWRAGLRDVQARRATWWWNGPDYGKYFHESRGLIGWTEDAEDAARQLVARAVADSQP